MLTIGHLSVRLLSLRLNPINGHQILLCPLTTVLLYAQAGPMGISGSPPSKGIPEGS